MTHRFNEFKVQTDAIRRGLLTVIPKSVLALLTWNELELQVCGTPTFDVDLFEKMCT